jgi:hypothetical protein
MRVTSCGSLLRLRLRFDGRFRAVWRWALSQATRLGGRPALFFVCETERREGRGGTNGDFGRAAALGFDEFHAVFDDRDEVLSTQFCPLVNGGDVSSC